MPECAYIDVILNMSWVLNMSKFSIWLSSEYASVTQRSEYARICLDRVNIEYCDTVKYRKQKTKKTKKI